MKTTEEKIEVMKAYADGKEIEWKFTNENTWKITHVPKWNWIERDYRVKEKVFTYPMWFKRINSNMIVRFDSLKSGEVVEDTDEEWLPKGYKSDSWTQHTDVDEWIQVEEPKETFTYPMWFKEKHLNILVKFTSLNSGEVVKQCKFPKGFTCTNWIPHTNKEIWIKVEEPKNTKIVKEWMYKLNNTWCLEN